MKAKQLITLAGVAAAMIGLAVWSSKQEARKTEAAAIGGKVLPDLQKQLNDIAAIRIQAPDSTVTVTRTEGVWRVPAKWNYPADFGKVRDLLNKLADVKTLQSIRTTPAERAELQLLTPADRGTTNREQTATLIQMLDKSGKAVSALYLGKVRSRPGPEPGMGGYPDGRFVMSSEGQTSLIGDSLSEVTTTGRDWLDNDFLNVSDVVAIHVSGGTNGEIRAERATPEGELKLKDPIPDTKEVDSSKLSQLGSALSYLRFEDVADPKLPPAQTGLDKPLTYEALSKKGEKITLRLGKSPAGDSRRYASVSVAFEAPAAPASSGSDTNQIAQAKARETENAKTAASVKTLNARLSPWIYLLGQSNAETLGMGYNELLKDKPKPQDKKEDAKKPGEHHDN